MNAVDAIEIVRDLAASSWHASAEERQAIEITARLVAAYDALAPDWSQAPEDATSYVIHADGKAEWLRVVSRDKQIAPIENGVQWSYQYVFYAEYAGLVVLPLGIDWRLCIWPRPEEPQP